MKRIWFRINKVCHFLNTSVCVEHELTLLCVSGKLLAFREAVTTLAVGLWMFMK